MSKIGYIYSSLNEEYTKEQIQAISDYGVEKKIFHYNTAELKEGDELIVYDLRSIGKTIIQLAAFFIELNKKNITWIILKKEDSFFNLSNEQLSHIILELSDIERFIISERATRGIKKAKLKGRVGGRSKTSNETIEKIRTLYYQNSYTLRQISEESGVSLGTVYKYVKNYK